MLSFPFAFLIFFGFGGGVVRIIIVIKKRREGDSTLNCKRTHTFFLHDYGEEDDDRVLHISCCMIWLKKILFMYSFSCRWVTNNNNITKEMTCDMRCVQFTIDTYLYFYVLRVCFSRLWLKWWKKVKRCDLTKFFLDFDIT